MREYIVWIHHTTNGEPVHTIRKNEEIVRCLNCKYIGYTVAFKNRGEYSDAEQVPFCDKLRRETREDFYCAWAVRK